MKPESIFALIGALAVVAGIAVWLLKKWAAKPNDWASKIPPQPPPMQTEEMKPAEQEKKPPILPPQKVVQPRPEQPKRK